jgi:hypothetical protein
MKAFFLVFMITTLYGCSTTVKCTNPSEKAEVALLDHGHHTSLLFHRPDEESLRFSYGDWDYYAMSENTLLNGLKALLWPTKAAIGRKNFRLSNFDKSQIKLKVPVPIEDIIFIGVEKPKLNRLIKKLNRVHKKNLEASHYNPLFDLIFTEHPKSYSLVNNSNQMVAEWLEELGCRTDIWVLFSSWELK